MVTTLTTEIPLDQLRRPDYDVRESRDPDEIRSLAQDIDQNGLRLPLDVYPANWEDYQDRDLDDQDVLQEMTDVADAFVVVDGWSRRRALKVLDRPTARAEVKPEPPNEQIAASIGANVSRLEMSDYELAVALQDWKENSGMTWAEMASRMPWAESTMKNYVRCLQAPDEVVQAWRAPETHLGQGHIFELIQLPTEDLMMRAFGKVMEYEMSVSRTREVCRNAKREYKKEQRAEEAREDKQADGHETQARQQAGRVIDEAEETPTCLICGEDADRRRAVPVCHEDYGLLSQLEQAGQALVPDREEPPEVPQEADD